MNGYNYNKDLKRFEFFDQRFYTDDDGETYFPSVTHVLDCFPKDSHLMDWLKDMGRNADIYIKEAGDVGTNVHNLIDQFLQNPGVEFHLVDSEGAPMYSKLEWKMALKALEFFDTVKPQIISTEQNIISKTMKIGGTLDLGCRIRNKTAIVDHKTSNSIQITHWIQLAVYAKLWNEVYPDQQVETCYILWLKADTRGESSIGKPSEPIERKLPTRKDPVFRKEPKEKKEPVRKKKDTEQEWIHIVNDYHSEHQKKLDEWVIDCDERRETCETEYEEKLSEYSQSARERVQEYHEKLKEWNDTKPIQGHGWQLKEMAWKMPDDQDDLIGPEAIEKYYQLYRCCRYLWNYLNPNFKPFNRKFPDRIVYKS